MILRFSIRQPSWCFHRKLNHAFTWFFKNIFLIYRSQHAIVLYQKLWWRNWLDLLYQCDVHSAMLTHWGRVTHICVSKLTIIGSDNGLSPGRRQAIIWTNAGILLIGTLGTNFSEILSNVIHFHSRKCIWKCRLENGGYLVSASMS